MSRKKADIAQVVLKAVRARQLGQKHYKRADALLSEITKEIEPGQVVKVSAERAFKLVDKFQGKDIVWNPCAARRWELEEVPA